MPFILQLGILIKKLLAFCLPDYFLVYVAPGDRVTVTAFMIPRMIGHAVSTGSMLGAFAAR